MPKVCYDAYRREKYNGDIFPPLSSLAQNLFMKKFAPVNGDFEPYCHFLWLNSLVLGKFLLISEKEQAKSYRVLFWGPARFTVCWDNDRFPENWYFAKKKWPLMTFGDLDTERKKGSSNFDWHLHKASCAVYRVSLFLLVPDIEGLVEISPAPVPWF